MFTIIDQTKTPVLENIIDICRIKTFVWIQLLCKNKMLKNIEFYDENSIYVDLKLCLKNIQIEFFGENKDIDRNYKLVLKHDNEYFVFKLVFEESMPKTEKKQTNDYTYNNGHNNGYVYPEILYFYKKIKNDVYFNKFLVSRFACNIKALFYGGITIQRIILIDKQGFQKILSLTASEYTTQKINYNMLNYSDITYVLFYHPTLNTIDNIYGFKYYVSNPASLFSIETRIKRPQKNIK